jgi:hypothetical protein
MIDISKYRSEYLFFGYSEVCVPVIWMRTWWGGQRVGKVVYNN